MSDEPEGPSREELLDSTPEAVAMRRTRALRAEASAKAEAARARQDAAPKPGSTRRRLILGGVLGLVTLARVLSKVNRTSRQP